MYNPFSKGRWHRFFIENDGGTHKLSESDLEGVAIASGHLNMPEDFHIVDFKVDVNSTAGTAHTFGLSGYFNSNGRQGITLPSTDNYDWCYIYVFGYSV